jgi:hypothetical protein
MSDGMSPGVARGIGQSLMGFGLAAWDKLDAAEKAVQYNSGLEILKRGLTTFQNKLRSNPNWEEYENLSAKEEETLWGQVDKITTNVGAKNSLNEAWMQMRDSNFATIKDMEFNVRGATLKGDALGTMNANIADAAGDPDERIKKNIETISIMVGQNLWTPEQGQQLIDQSTHDINVNTVMNGAWGNYQAGLSWTKYLEDPKNQRGLSGDEIQNIYRNINTRVSELRTAQKFAWDQNNSIIQESWLQQLVNLREGKAKSDLLTYDDIRAGEVKQQDGTVVKLQGDDGPAIQEKYLGYLREFYDSPDGAKKSDPRTLNDLIVKVFEYAGDRTATYRKAVSDEITTRFITDKKLTAGDAKMLYLGLKEAADPMLARDLSDLAEPQYSDPDNKYLQDLTATAQRDFLEYMRTPGVKTEADKKTMHQKLKDYVVDNWEQNKVDTFFSGQWGFRGKGSIGQRVGNLFSFAPGSKTTAESHAYTVKALKNVQSGDFIQWASFGDSTAKNVITDLQTQAQEDFESATGRKIAQVQAETGKLDWDKDYVLMLLKDDKGLTWSPYAEGDKIYWRYAKQDDKGKWYWVYWDKP